MTSNNNGAVENITHGLSGRKDLPERYDTEKHRYFAQVSDRLLGDGNTWALHAAALGNKGNRGRFIRNLWPINEEEEKGGFNFRTFLRESVRTFQPDLWKEAKHAFAAKLAQVQAEYDRIGAVYARAEELRTLRQKLAGAEERIPALEAELSDADRRRGETELLWRAKEEQRKDLEDEIAYLVRTTPLLGLREIFCRNSPAVKEIDRKRSTRSEVRRESEELHRGLEELWQRAGQLQGDLAGKRAALESGAHRIRALQALLEDFRRETGMPFRLDEFFEDCGAGELCDNLDGYNKLMRGMLPKAQAEKLAAPLLQSLFLLVPVISTTFASVGSFLRDIPAGEIAYLFIDEAGQAVPQSAAGAVWRARKVIAVGNPLQIEPVVTLHDAVMEVLGRCFDQEPVLMDKYTSMQSLADLANRLGRWRQVSRPGNLWIGAPLVVHSRCQRRMFTISNHIAYNHKMIFDTRERKGAVCRWPDVRGSSKSGHYVQAQAEAAIPLVTAAFVEFMSHGLRNSKYPSLFVITPFRSTRAGRQPISAKNCPGSWNWPDWIPGAGSFGPVSRSG